MAITATDIVFRYSVVTGAAGDSTAGTAAGSLGKYVSTTAVAAGLNGLFDDVSGAENAASTVDYRCVFVLNNHGSLAYQNAVVYMSAETAGGAAIAIATDNIAASAKGGAGAQGALIASETTAPSGVSAFSSPTTAGAGLTLGTSTPVRSREFGYGVQRPTPRPWTPMALPLSSPATLRRRRRQIWARLWLLAGLLVCAGTLWFLES